MPRRAREHVTPFPHGSVRSWSDRRTHALVARRIPSRRGKGGATTTGGEACPLQSDRIRAVQPKSLRGIGSSPSSSLGAPQANGRELSPRSSPRRGTGGSPSPSRPAAPSQSTAARFSRLFLPETAQNCCAGARRVSNKRTEPTGGGLSLKSTPRPARRCRG
jgi:hypothetical protein